MGHNYLLNTKAKRMKEKHVSMCETSCQSCGCLNGVDFYYNFYHSFKSAVTFYSYTFSYEIKWWHLQNLISSLISLIRLLFCTMWYWMFISSQNLKILWWSHCFYGDLIDLPFYTARDEQWEKNDKNIFTTGWNI